ncbi:ribulose-phosphate 3-epimerase [Clostridium algidicarnis]|uniref:Ribulose-phosphate 3-epimerase n=1 Tax=Clostridium algidicarnis DSM 15099 TaxID=1121295 RepID=A0A2S6G1C2_9CLOT|nr:ribulose-phosphate 3-epimerase [Clostridium algidicarnis]MBU3203202.1 ribulose-phosphate 3-epimerase [Clostridium algidicarnis]MBU3205504.1 ribulose-phosphate 3-epimerase [Clostridium algidicarnis]MBU3211356.1 ribulose-phosphate 3-epimerase [Clostridium algidicarnis]MBU3222136.1 ribulose-phosphate 3-epimerase [Clostridium algidicarnis]PPK49676.1 ribulose-phosphate 3-epimerase [Clostridium algidicarnis DSM 15099]
MVKIAPSILSADFSKLGEHITRLDNSEADIIHIDVMDGRFVPNISFGMPIIKSIRPYTKKEFDVHLMIEEPSKYIEEFAKAGADIITVHYESEKHLDKTITHIKELGIKAAVALNPATPINVLESILKELDMVLIMSVNPGFGGQKYIKYCDEKIKDLKQMILKTGKDIAIEVDGGIDLTNIKDVSSSGADIIVAGSAVFKQDRIEENIKNLKEVTK